jgi:hypothetical protein
MIGTGAADWLSSIQMIRWVQVVPHLGGVPTMISPGRADRRLQTRLSQCQLMTVFSASRTSMIVTPGNESVTECRRRNQLPIRRAERAGFNARCAR